MFQDKLVLFILSLLSIQGLSQSDSLPFNNSEYLQVDAFEIHYRQFLPDSDSIRGRILLVHGFAGSTFSWRYQFDTLTSLGYEVVALDVPPFGYSSKPKRQNYSMSIQSQRMWKFVNTLYGDSTQSWILMGHSMGAGIVGAMAANQPKRVEAVVFVDGIMFEGGIKVAKFLKRSLGSEFGRTVAWFAERFVLVKRRQVARFVQDACKVYPDSAMVEGYYRPLRNRGLGRSISDAAKYGQEVFRYHAAQIEAPALIIWGKEDTWVPLSDGEGFEQRLKHVKKIVIEECGHCPLETHAGVVNEVIVKFLETAN